MIDNNIKINPYRNSFVDISPYYNLGGKKMHDQVVYYNPINKIAYSDTEEEKPPVTVGLQTATGTILIYSILYLIFFVLHLL